MKTKKSSCMPNQSGDNKGTTKNCGGGPPKAKGGAFYGGSCSKEGSKKPVAKTPKQQV